jgi:uncharacterized membrane protein YedE/YeeE
MMLPNLLRGAFGGVLIGLAASLLLLTHGKIAGISGMLGGLLDTKTTERGYRAWFLAGLLLMGLVLAFVRPELLASASGSSAPLALTAVAGLLVGFGTSLGNGCTSGHGICGLSRLSPRSLLATATFMVTGALTVFVARHLIGGAP